MRIAVIGAGIVGVSAAEWLRRDGHAVTLFDPVPPGSPAQASYGNAGLLARAAVVPVPKPGLMWQAPRMLGGPLFLRWRYLPRLLPWLVPYLATGRKETVRRTAAALADLLSDAVDQHLALARGTPAERFVETGDYVYLYRDRAAFEADREAWAIHAACGLPFEPRSGDALRDADPHLGPEIGWGVTQPGHGWITDPGRYVAALAEHCRQQGGTLVGRAVERLRPVEHGVELATADEARHFDRAVLSAGAWSGDLVRQLRHRPALESERGYHLVMKGVPFRPPNPYMLADAAMAVTPMDAGIRAAGLVEFAGLDAPPRSAPVAFLRRSMRRLYPDLDWEAEETWMGHRPSTIDSLPQIGPAPNAPAVWFAFGAQHVGLTSGPKTGRLIADWLAGRRPNIDMSPFAPGRFDP